MTSLLWWVLVAVVGVVGFIGGAIRLEWTLDRVWEQWEADHEEAFSVAAAASLRAVPAAAGRVVGDDGGGEGAPGMLAGDPRPASGQVDVPRPGMRDRNPDSGLSETLRLSAEGNAPGPGHPVLTGEAWQPDGHLLASMTPRMRERYEQDDLDVPRPAASGLAEVSGPGPADRGIFAFIDDDAEAFRYIRWGLAGLRAELARPLELPAWPQLALAAA